MTYPASPPVRTLKHRTANELNRLYSSATGKEYRIVSGLLNRAGTSWASTSHRLENTSSMLSPTFVSRTRDPRNNCRESKHPRIIIQHMHPIHSLTSNTSK